MELIEVQIMSFIHHRPDFVHEKLVHESAPAVDDMLDCFEDRSWRDDGGPHLAAIEVLLRSTAGTAPRVYANHASL